MSAVVGALRANLSASIAQFRDDMGKAADSVKKFAGDVDKQSKRMEKVGSKLSIAITAPLVAFGYKAVQAGIESAQAFGQVEAALKSTGGQSGKTAVELQKSAKALEAISLYDDDQILKDVTAGLLRFGNIQGDVFDRAQLAIIDFAARMQMDLPAATTLVGKAVNQPVTGLKALKKAGVEFTDEQKKMFAAAVANNRGLDAQNVILDALGKNFKGAAKTARDNNPFAALQLSLRNLAETVGPLIVQTMKPITEFVKNISDVFMALTPETQNLVVQLGLIAAVAGPLLVTLANLIVVLKNLAIAVVFLTTTSTGLILLVGLLAAAGLVWVASSDKASGAAKDQAAAHDILTKALVDAKASGDKMAKSDADLAREKLKLAAATLKSAEAQAQENLFRAQAEAASPIANPDPQLVDVLKPGVAQARDSLDQIHKLQRENAADMAVLNKAVAAPAPAAGGKGRGAGGAGGGTHFDLAPEMVAATKKFQESIRGMDTKIKAGFDDLELPKSIASANSLNAQIDEFVKQAQDAGVNTGAFKTQLEGLRKRIEDLKQAGLVKEAEKFSRAVDEDSIAVNRFAHGSLDPLDEKLQSVDDAYQSLKDKITQQIEDNKVLGESNEGARATMVRLQDQLAKLEGAHQAAADAARAQYEAESSLRDLQTQAENLQTSKNIRDLQQASGGAQGPISTHQQNMQDAQDTLDQQRIESAIKLKDLDNQLVEARRIGDMDEEKRLESQISLQQQFHDLVQSTTAEQIDATRRINEAFKSFTDDLTNSLTDMLSNWNGDLSDIRNVFKNLAKELFIRPVAQQISDGIGGGIKSLLGGGFGGGGGVGEANGGGDFIGTDQQSSGGIWQGIGNFFSGMFAEGGFIPPGQWGIAGEKGPEPVYGGKTGATVQANSGGGTVVQNFNIGRMDQNTFKQTRRQFGRIAKEAMG